MNIERPGSPSATTVAPTSKRRSTSIETRRSRLASERPPKKGVAIRNAFRSGELIAIGLIYSPSASRARDGFVAHRGLKGHEGHEDSSLPEVRNRYSISQISIGVPR